MVPGAYTVAMVSGCRQQRRLLPAVWVVAVVTVLLLIVAVGAASHHVAVPLCAILLPVFLFAMVEIEERRLAGVGDAGCHRLLNSEHPSFFQRPPPFFA